MHVRVVLDEGVPPRGAVVAQVARELLELLVDGLDVALEVPLLGALEVAQVAREVLDLAVHGLDVGGHVVVGRRLEITVRAGELLLLGALLSCPGGGAPAALAAGGGGPARAGHHHGAAGATHAGDDGADAGKDAVGGGGSGGLRLARFPLLLDCKKQERNDALGRSRQSANNCRSKESFAFIPHLSPLPP